MSAYLKTTCGAAFAMTLLAAMVSGLVSGPLSGLARAQEAPPAREREAPPPERLTIGYEDEGKIDVSPQACVAWVKEETDGWKQTEIEEAARKLCASRKRHVEAYEAFQSHYRMLMRLAAKDVRLSPADAAENLKIIVKACIDHKTGLTTGGHNVMVPVIENDIIAKCLTWSSDLLRDEIHELRRYYPD